MNWSRGYFPSVSCCYILVKVPSPYPCPSVTNHRLASLMEAGDTSGVSYAVHTSIRPRGEGTPAILC